MSAGSLGFVFSVVSFVISCGLTCLLLRTDSRVLTLDHPNPRSLHGVPTPSGGGVAVACTIFVGGSGAACLTATWPLVWVGIAALGVAGTSFVDDHRPLSPALRLGVHFAAAAAVVGGGLGFTHVVLPGLSWSLPSWLGIIGAVMSVVWMTNLFNFMDGMDGLAGGMSTIGFSTYAILGYQSGDQAFLATSLVIAAASAGFLVFNFPPAKIFMGDVGSSTLGLLAGALTLWGSSQQLFPLWLGGLVFSPFIVDATVTLTARALRGARVWEAHRTHFYQRLVRSGWSHRRAVLWEYALMVACSGCALVGLSWSTGAQWLLLCGWGLVYIILMVTVRRIELVGGTGT